MRFKDVNKDVLHLLDKEIILWRIHKNSQEFLWKQKKNNDKWLGKIIKQFLSFESNQLRFLDVRLKASSDRMKASSGNLADFSGLHLDCLWWWSLRGAHTETAMKIVYNVNYYADFPITQQVAQL